MPSVRDPVQSIVTVSLRIHLDEGRRPIVFIDNENNMLYCFTMNENNWRAKWDPDQLKAMLIEQRQAFWSRDIGLERDRLRCKQLPVISPARRSIQPDADSRIERPQVL